MVMCVHLNKSLHNLVIQAEISVIQNDLTFFRVVVNGSWSHETNMKNVSKPPVNQHMSTKFCVYDGEVVINKDKTKD